MDPLQRNFNVGASLLAKFIREQARSHNPP